MRIDEAKRTAAAYGLTLINQRTRDVFLPSTESEKRDWYGDTYEVFDENHIPLNVRFIPHQADNSPWLLKITSYEQDGGTFTPHSHDWRSFSTLSELIPYARSHRLGVFGSSYDFSTLTIRGGPKE